MPAVSFIKRKTSEKFQLALGKVQQILKILFLQFFLLAFCARGFSTETTSLGFFLVEEKVWILTIFLLLNRDGWSAQELHLNQEEKRMPTLLPENSDQASRPNPAWTPWEIQLYL